MAVGGLFCGIRSVEAADIPLKAPREAVAPEYVWTGFYVGAHGGDAWGRNRFGDPTASFTALNNPFEVASKGPVFGGQIGLNWQVGNFVLGAEADVDWGALRGDYLFFPVISTSQTSSNIRALATGTGRFGVAMGQWLAYLKGGVAWSDVDFTNTSVAPFTVTVTQQRTGLTGGIGLEVAFWQNVSAKIEYDYLYFGRQTVVFQGSGPTRPLDVDQQVQVIKAGFNVRFGSGATMTRY